MCSKPSADCYTTLSNPALFAIAFRPLFPWLGACPLGCYTHTLPGEADRAGIAERGSGSSWRTWWAVTSPMPASSMASTTSCIRFAHTHPPPPPTPPPHTHLLVFLPAPPTPHPPPCTYPPTRPPPKAPTHPHAVHKTVGQATCVRVCHVNLHSCSG